MKTILEAILWLVLYVVIYANVVYGQDIYIVHARGDRIASYTLSRQIVDHALDIIKRDTGIDVNVRSFRSMKNPNQRLHNRGLRYRERVLYRWTNYFSRRKQRRGFALVPTFNDQGFKYMAGYSSGICSRGAGYATVQHVNQFGTDRYIHSVVNVAHEVGHLLGASHDNTQPAVLIR